MFSAHFKTAGFLLIISVIGGLSGAAVQKGDSIPSLRSHSHHAHKHWAALPKLQSTVQRKPSVPAPAEAPKQTQSSDAPADLDEAPTPPLSGLSAAMAGIDSQISTLESLESQVLNEQVHFLEVSKARYERELREQDESNNAVVRENEAIQTDIANLVKGNDQLRKQAQELQASNSLTRDQLRAAESSSGLSQKFAATSLDSMDDSHEKDLDILGTKDAVVAPAPKKPVTPEAPSSAVVETAASSDPTPVEGADASVPAPTPSGQADAPIKKKHGHKRHAHKRVALTEVSSTDSEAAAAADSDEDDDSEAAPVSQETDDASVATDADDAASLDNSDSEDDDSAEDVLSFLAVSSKSKRSAIATTADSEGMAAMRALAEMKADSALNGPSSVVSTSAPPASTVAPTALATPKNASNAKALLKVAQESAKPAIEVPIAMPLVSTSASSEKLMIKTLQHNLADLAAQKRGTESSLTSVFDGAHKAGAARHTALLAQQAQLKAKRKLLTNAKTALTAAVAHLERTRQQLQQRLQSLGDMAKKLMKMLLAPAAEAPALLKSMPIAAATDTS